MVFSTDVDIYESLSRANGLTCAVPVPARALTGANVAAKNLAGLKVLKSK